MVICITDSLANTKWRKCINPMGVNLGVVVVASTIRSPVKNLMQKEKVAKVVKVKGWIS